MYLGPLDYFLFHKIDDQVGMVDVEPIKLSPTSRNQRVLEEII
jgi:hypothetical protein